ncbi:hypothetical protein [Desulfocicer vacuolatum]|uniref:hypothetical protein n=1 Tax=Desulfocicer vacuolatum TaxID=2298 RepID=UPI001BAFDF6D|nr:hypothetical protein [Desulfocicer vacuolatum]
MKYSANRGCISNFVVTGSRSEWNQPAAVIYCSWYISVVKTAKDYHFFMNR